MAKRTRTTNRPSAAETYAARRADIARLWDVIDMELGKHADAANADPNNWGRVGDLGHIRGDLINVVSFLSGMETEEIERFMNDAE